MTQLTPMQAEVLRYIREFQWAYRRSPSLREITEHYAYKSMNSAAKMVNALSAEGCIERDSNGTIPFPRESLSRDYFQSFL